jgi:hypothetical protein
LKVTVKTAGYHGKVTKTIALKSDDPVRPDVTLKVKMNLVGSALVLPAKTMLLRHRRDQPTTGRLLIRKDPTETGSLNVTEVASSEPWLAVRMRKVEAEEPMERGIIAVPGDFMLEFEVPLKPKAGLHRAEVTFRTGLPREPVMSIPITVTARAFGAASIQRLSLRRMTAEGPIAGQMTFKLLGGQGADTVKVEVSPDRYIAEVKVLNPGQLQVQVSQDPDMDNGEPLPEGVLRFTQGGETVSVPVQPPAP